MKYIVLEIQKNADESVSTLLYSYSDRNSAEQKYHLVLAAAAVSQLPSHTAVLLTDDGRMISTQSYIHETEEPVEQEGE